MSDLHQRIQQQYASERGRHFYKTVMGDGGFDVHYGLYDNADATMSEATLAATKRLVELALRVIDPSEITAILDLGSGRGGSAHYLASRFECVVTCVDLCQEHHEENHRQASTLGVADRIDTWLGSFESLPDEWIALYDVTWGQESFCHAEDQDQLMEEAFRVTRPGGAIVFSDILLSDQASDADAAAFSDVNAVITLSTLDQHRHRMTRAGFRNIQFEDWTHHLGANFKRMLNQINHHREQLQHQGVDAEYIEEFERSLRQRLQWTEGSVLQWGAFTAVARR